MAEGPDYWIEFVPKTAVAPLKARVDEDTLLREAWIRRSLSFEVARLADFEDWMEFVDFLFEKHREEPYVIGHTPPPLVELVAIDQLAWGATCKNDNSER